MGYEWEKDCVHVPFGLVSLSDGDDIKMMSTREGTVVFLEDVLNTAVEKTAEIMREKNAQGVDIDAVSKEVGIGAVIFQELSNNRIKDYVFSWDKVLNFDGETGLYVQYTHARASSAMRQRTNWQTSEPADSTRAICRATALTHSSNSCTECLKSFSKQLTNMSRRSLQDTLWT